MKTTSTAVYTLTFENGDTIIGVNHRGRYGKEYHILLSDTMEISVYNADEMKEVYGYEGSFDNQFVI